MRATYAHCEYLDREIVNQHAVVDRVRETAELERAKLIDLTKDKKVLETLKTRRSEAFEAEAAAIEQNQLDDINARIFDRTPGRFHDDRHAPTQTRRRARFRSSCRLPRSPCSRSP